MNPRCASAATLLAMLAGTACGQSTTPFPAHFQLSSLAPSGGGNGSNGFVINGVAMGDYSGIAVSSAGDINGDGIDDLLIGAKSADVPGQTNAGKSYVVFGNSGVGTGGVIELSALNGINGFAINGVAAGDESGSAVSAAGDVNGDGYDDLVIGAKWADPNGFTAGGQSSVVFGGAGVGGTGTLELSTLNGSNGFFINGVSPNDFSGTSVSAAGDFNGDGYADVIIGASWAGGNTSGASYVVFGGAGVGSSGAVELSTLNGTNGFVINGLVQLDRFGNSVSSTGDVNGDGFDDIIVGAYHASPNGIAYAGQSYVVFGGPGVGSTGVINPATLNGSDGLRLNGIALGNSSGRSVSSAGDVNGDGFADFIIGANWASPIGKPYAGESSVVFGGTRISASGVIELSSLNGTNGFVISGAAANDFSGDSVSAAGDINGDGISDLIIGAKSASPNGNGAPGESYVVFGGIGIGSTGVLELSSLNGSNGFAISGINPNDSSGTSVSSAGDVNGDGIDDLVIGAKFADPNGISAAGESYVVFGRGSANAWVHPAGGSFGTGSNWQGGKTPTGGMVTISTPIGVTVSGPAGGVFLDRLDLGAGMGRTTLDLQPFSLVSVVQPFAVPISAALSGSGVFLSNGLFSNAGLVSLDGMSLLAPQGVTNQSGGLITVIDGFLDGALSNSGDTDISALSSPTGVARLEITGLVTNEYGGNLRFRQGSAELVAPAGLTNHGTVSMTLSNAAVLGSVTNENTVIPGSAIGGSGSIELSSLNGTNGFALLGTASLDLSGYSVCSAGDLNGDGFDDLIIGASNATPPSMYYGAGKSYVVFGGPGVGSSGIIDLASLNGSNGFVLNGNYYYDHSGSALSSAGDINGDGFADLIIGASDATPPSMYYGAGKSYVVFGGPGVGSSGSIDLASLNGTNGFVLNGVYSYDASGVSVSSAGDVNGDGINDLIIGAFLAGPNLLNAAGESYVVFGTSGIGAGGAIDLSSLTGSNGFTIHGTSTTDHSGYSVSSAGDMNGDGVDDLIIGAKGADPNGLSAAGKSYVVFGRAGIGASGVLELSTLNGSNGFALHGVSTGDNSGASVSSAGDVNGDGFADLIIGAKYGDPNAASNAGESYIVFGSPGVGSSGVIELSTLNGTNGYVINGIHAGDISGSVVSATGDVNGDGVSDIIIGAHNADPNGLANAGESYVVFGGSGTGSSGALELSALNGINGFVINGINAGDASGFAVSSAGDFNGDGVSDILIGARTADPNGLLNAGESYVVFGKAGTMGSSLLSISGATNALISGNLTNSASVVLTNDSSLVILGALIGSGVSGPGGPGTAGTVYAQGGVLPGLPIQTFGVTQFDGDINLGPSGTTIIEIGGAVPGVNLDQITTAKDFAAGGILEVRLANGFSPSPGDAYQILNFSTSSGAFTSVNLDPALISAGADTSQLLTTGLIVIPPLCPADLNGDGFLDNGDISTFISLFLSGNLAADMNGDGFLDNGDISTFIALFLAGC